MFLPCKSLSFVCLSGICLLLASSSVSSAAPIAQVPEANGAPDIPVYFTNTPDQSQLDYINSIAAEIARTAPVPTPIMPTPLPASSTSPPNGPMAQKNKAKAQAAADCS